MAIKKQPKIKPCPVTVSLEPENQETPVHFVEDWITPEEFFYKRNHFPYPPPDDVPTTLKIEGLVKRPLVLDYKQLLSLPAKTLIATLECAGNKRILFHPRVYGVQWQKGAISQGIWGGVPLYTLLRMAGIKRSARDIVFTGADRGPDQSVYERSLPVEKAMHPDTIVAYQMNGGPIPHAHGFPFRLIVPGWYAMASVKWLCKITAIDSAFEGSFQTTDYMYYPHADTDDGKKPVTTIKVNSFIQQPQDYDTLKKGLNLIKGFAWTGKGTISKVEVSTDNGVSWKPASLFKSQHPYAWTFWKYEWQAEQKGEFIILARAKDSTGRVQPMVPEWNRKGYGYNAITSIRVQVK
ncbi:sulfite oxidase [Paenactinomyces guangxiensis]|uniref:Sulfite oxidase n=1 Tax=Paenactinomyces guangxiensis TaxID=1490290 RepID=A0A7W1WPZ4_9BACL|nr:sulfite oxidase [Paenactinomyces guangxiensis]MBA4493941.1 sulfite oxidase [Paenactinomyces guangxiensis]MBH8591408.1 sulfite oxidase [Paenactinomyces guangxiensis]